MVVIHVKRTEKDTFLYETTCSASNDLVTRDLVRLLRGRHEAAAAPSCQPARTQCLISNLREKISRLAGAVEELAKHGPAKPEAERGLDEVRAGGWGAGGSSSSGWGGSSPSEATPRAQIQEQTGKVIAKGPFYSADPLGNRYATFVAGPGAATGALPA